MTDFLDLTSLSGAEVAGLVALASRCQQRPRSVASALKGKSVVCIFEKPSLRTRMSFEVGIWRMGGQPIIYDTAGQRLGARESIKDYAMNLERMVHAIVARVYDQATLEGLARHASVPVVNALSNDHHPCQALADLLTITQRLGKVKGKRVCFIGDGNNVCRSLAEGVCKLGGHMVVISPEGYALDESIVIGLRADAKASGGSIAVSSDPADLAGAEVVYTDEWASMHHADGAARADRFRPYQVNAALMARADKRAIFMHCLPAARGQEVTDEVIDGDRSVVYQEAENRIYAQQAVLMTLLGKRSGGIAGAGSGGSSKGKSGAKSASARRRA